MALKGPPRAATLVWAALVAASASAAEDPATAGDGDAQHAYDAGLYTAARQLWTPRAEAGDVQAQLNLALMDDLGQGAPRDTAKAYEWYRRAAETGSAEAEFNAAVMNDMGDGTQRDVAAAALWYARAAAHGNHRAQYNLGQLYAAGDGVPRNAAVAAAYFRAASTELPAALDKLAGLQRSGRMVQQAAGSTGEMPRPAQPRTPVDHDAVRTIAGPAGASVELVWTAPAQALAVRFFVQVLALDEAGSHEVFATTVDDTSLLAPVQHVPGQYAWRVYSTGSGLRHYAASDWERFDVSASR